MLALLGLFAACGNTPPVTHALDLQSLTETRAIELIREVLGEVGLGYERSWPIRIGSGQALQVDVRLTETPFGIEWISPQDRVDHGAALPDPDPDGQLRIVPGGGPDGQAQVLVLDHRSYRYDPRRENVDRGAPGFRDVESRVRRDLRDFLEYVRGQTGQ
jgi:hypothetical protein